MSPEELRQRYPNGWAHICGQKGVLTAREGGKWRNAQWYAYGRSQNLTKMDDPKLVIQVTAQRPTVLYDDVGLHVTGGGSGPFYGIRTRDVWHSLSMKCLLGILNSDLFGWMVKVQSTNLRGGYIKFSKQYIEGVPIAAPDRAAHNRMVQLVTSMLELHRRLAAATSEAERTLLERQIAATDAEIDRLVYGLYGLSDEEIAVVESGE